MTEKKSKEDQSEWKKKKTDPNMSNLTKILNEFLLLVDEERKLTLEKIERTKKALERMKQNR